MAIVFKYAVKYNGKYYPPNTPIEDEPVETVEKPVENPVEKVENTENDVPVVENPVENVENPKPRKKRGAKEE